MTYRNTFLWIAIYAVCSPPPAFGQVFGNQHESWLPPLDVKFNLTQTEQGNEIQNIMSQILDDPVDDVTDRASRAVQQGVPSVDVSSACLKDFGTFLAALTGGEQWALRMVDATGKPPSGLLDGNFKWLGNFDECIAITAMVNDSGAISFPYEGRYCLSSFKIKQLPPVNGQQPAIQIGMCVPDSCASKDMLTLVETVLKLIPVNASSLPEPEVTCQEEILLDTKAIVAIAICSIFVVVMTIATLYDVYLTHFDNNVPKQPTITEKQNGRVNDYVVSNVMGSKEAYEYTLPANGKVIEEIETGEKAPPPSQPGTVSKALLAFSIYTNTAKILDTKQPAGSLTALNGVRFISMTWVILGHVIAFSVPHAENVGPYSADIFTRFTYQAILNATPSVDSFFTLSGLLVSYLSLKTMKKLGGAKRFQWGMFYFHRFWRLTPPYMLFMMFYVCLSKYMYNGPEWAQEGIDSKTCGQYWWRNLLYINNLFPVTDMCMGHAWYLANDMQFYVLSPLMLIPLYYSTTLGILSCGALLAVCWGSAGYISYRDHSPPNLMFDQTGKIFDTIYDKPWARIGPYVIGFFAGYVLYITNCKLKIPRILNLFCWLVATAIGILVIYGLYDDTGVPQLSNTLNAVYNAASRSGWGLAVSWVIVACATGNGGFVNTLLSWKAFIPLSRLTYCAYLVHPIVMYFVLLSLRKLIYFTDLQVALLFCGFLCFSYGVAFITSLAFESPMMGLEKALLGRSKKS